MSLCLALAAVAAAQEGGDGGPPLAIPATTPVPVEPAPETGERAPEGVVVPDRPLAIPGGREGQVDAHGVREYRSRYLALRNLSEAYVGTTWSYGWSGGYGWHGPGWGGWVGWPHPFVVRHDEQAVFQGPNRLDVPEILGALGDVTGRQQIERRIRKNRTAATVLYGLGVAGIAGSVVGLVGSDQARTYDEITMWNAVSWGGVGLMVGGFVGGSFPGSRALRLQLEPEVTFEMPELQQRIEEHNEALASELGLDPMDAVRLEGPPPGYSRTAAGRPEERN